MRTWIAVLVGASVGLGLGLGLGWARQAEPRLEQRLARVEAENAVLRSQLEALVEDAAGRSGDADPSGQLALVPDPEAHANERGVGEPAEPELEADPSDSQPAGSGPAEGGSAFDEARLAALGFHASDIERLREAWEELALEKLYIQDERARSSQRDGRHWARLVALERDAVAELGEEDYDALLYASGDRNRVRVRNVLPESAAEVAGLAPGDEVISYDDEPVFRMMALKQGTIGCEGGTTVALGITREGGGESRVWVPCGPLGIELEMVNAEPR